MKKKESMNDVYDGTIVMDNATLSRWMIKVDVEERNNNALTLTISQPIDCALEAKFTFLDTDLVALANFGELLCKKASYLMRKQAKKNKK